MEVWKSGLGMDGCMEVWIRDGCMYGSLDVCMSGLGMEVWKSGLGMDGCMEVWIRDGCMYVCLDISLD